MIHQTISDFLRLTCSIHFKPCLTAEILYAIMQKATVKTFLDTLFLEDVLYDTCETFLHNAAASYLQDDGIWCYLGAVYMAQEFHTDKMPLILECVKQHLAVNSITDNDLFLQSILQQWNLVKKWK